MPGKAKNRNLLLPKRRCLSDSLDALMKRNSVKNVADSHNIVTHTKYCCKSKFEVDAPHKQTLAARNGEASTVLMADNDDYDDDGQSLTAEQKIWKNVSNVAKFTDDSCSILTTDVLPADILQAMRRRGSRTTTTSEQVTNQDGSVHVSKPETCENLESSTLPKSDGDAAANQSGQIKEYQAAPTAVLSGENSHKDKASTDADFAKDTATHTHVIYKRNNDNESAPQRTEITHVRLTKDQSAGSPNRSKKSKPCDLAHVSNEGTPKEALPSGTKTPKTKRINTTEDESQRNTAEKTKVAATILAKRKQRRKVKPSAAPLSLDSFSCYYDAPNNSNNRIPTIPASTASKQSPPDMIKNKLWLALSPRRYIVSPAASSVRSYKTHAAANTTSSSPLKLIREMSLLFPWNRTEAGDVDCGKPNIIDTGRSEARFYPDLSHSNDDNDGLLLSQY